jgi:hypothetical protein
MVDNGFQNILQQPNALLRIAEAGGFCVDRKSHGGFSKPFPVEGRAIERSVHPISRKQFRLTNFHRWSLAPIRHFQI